MRSKEVREKAFEIDKNTCQICGLVCENEYMKKFLAPHHVEEVGMGGSKELDTLDNVITVCYGLPRGRKTILRSGEGSCHQMLHNGELIIEEFERDGNGNIVNLAVKDKAGNQIDTWWDILKQVEIGRQIAERLKEKSIEDREVAHDAFILQQIFDLISPERSFKQYLSSEGIDSRMERLANLFARSLELGAPWPDGVSAKDYRQSLKDSGKTKERMFYHLLFKDEETLFRLLNNGDVRITHDVDSKLSDQYPVGVRVNKWWRIKPSKGHLYLSGRSLPQFTFPSD